MAKVKKGHLLLCIVSVLLSNAVLSGSEKVLGPTGVSAYDALIQRGLVDIQSVDSMILVQLKYSDSSNFMGVDVYGDLESCFLQKNAALKLADASRILRSKHPGYRLLVVDGLRPRSIQYKMWNIVKHTPMQRYVANPRFGSMHNYGCAVDLTIADSSGNRLDMGTQMDHFGMLAQPVLESRFLKEKKLTEEQVANRRILRDVMVAAGFHPIAIEWWHFEAFEKDYIRTTFDIIE